MRTVVVCGGLAAFYDTNTIQRYLKYITDTFIAKKQINISSGLLRSKLVLYARNICTPVPN